MNLSYYQYVYIILNAFRTYIIFRFMHIFYEERRGEVWTEWLGYGVYYVVITLAYLLNGVPIILLLLNLCGLWGLGFLYKTTNAVRLISALSIYFIFMATETGVVVLSGYIIAGMFVQSEYTSISGLILVYVCTFFVEIFCEQCKNIKNGRDLPYSYWLALVALPATSLYIIVLLLVYNAYGDRVIIFITGLLLLCNICVFYLVDLVAKRERERSQYLIEEKEVESIKKQMELLQSSSEKMREFKHDLKNHLLGIQSLNMAGDKGEIQTYIKTLLQEGNLIENYIHTGNITADGILNLKQMDAEKLGIKFTTDIKMPIDLKITPYDWTVILGNLLDNAIEASEKVPLSDRYIKVMILYAKGTLLIHIENAFQGKIQYFDSLKQRLKTTKADKASHGIGLTNIRETIKHYDGELILEQDNKIFSAEIILYVT